jgi:hypothetical protein
MATTELEKLERRYAENPQGLTFAPLAEVHRKNGDVARALELLRSGLELHPNYIPASIVLGRCHLDSGDLPAAEAAFSHVLRLDDENVIALKSLADINEKLERFTDAQRWLNRLISVDRSNEEARQQLARLEAAKQKPRAEPPGAPVPLAATTPASEAAGAETPAAASRAIREASSLPEPVAEMPPAPVPLDLTAAIAEPSAEPFSTSEPPAEPSSAKAPVLEFLDTSEPPNGGGEPGTLALEDVPEPQGASTDGAAPPLDGLISQEFVPPKESTYRLHPELTQEIVAAGEVSRRDEEPDTLEVETAEEVELQSSGADEFRVPNAAEDFMVEPPPPPPAAAPPPSRDPELPKMAPEPARPSYSARETQGQSVAAFFQAMLAARPPGNPPSSQAASVNRDQTPGSTGMRAPGTGREDAVPPPSTTSPAPALDAPDVSFDDFFGAPADGSSPMPSGGADPGKDDLDQFQSWLQNLKR